VIYLYYGENDLLRKRAVDELVAAFTQKYGVDAVSQINCSDIEPQRLIAEIVNINMFAPERLILLDSLDKKVIALGGIDEENLLEVKDFGFGGAAILGALWNKFDACTDRDYRCVIEHFRKLRDLAD
jgi:hypothetical protein